MNGNILMCVSVTVATPLLSQHTHLQWKFPHFLLQLHSLSVSTFMLNVQHFIADCSCGVWTSAGQMKLCEVLNCLTLMF